MVTTERLQMAKIKLLGTGLNGLVGSKLVKDFANKYEFDNLDLRNPARPVDITNAEQVKVVVAQSEAEFLIHFAAFTDVNAAWEQRQDKTASCYQVNVEGTRNIAEACRQTGKHLIHISTAYVFDGQKEGLYTEEDPLSPIEWYGQTKAWAEELIEDMSDLKWTVLRIDQPFRSDNFAKLDIAHKLITGMRAGKIYPQFTDHYFGPTFIDDFAKVVDAVVAEKISGLFNASSGEQWTDFQFAQAVAEHLDPSFPVQAGSLKEYLKSTQRPYQKNTALNCQKLQSVLPFKLNKIETAIKKIEL